MAVGAEEMSHRSSAARYADYVLDVTRVRVDVEQAARDLQPRLVPDVQQRVEHEHVGSPAVHGHLHGDHSLAYKLHALAVSKA